MEDKQFVITINAPTSKVWGTLWGPDTYPQWTEPFCAGSHAEGEWQEGSKILFMDPNRDGMVSTIVKLVPNEHLSFKMLGVINKGVEDYDSPAAKALAGGYENYTLTEENGKTTLKCEVIGEMPPDIEQYLLAAWPKALDKLKEIAEQ